MRQGVSEKLFVRLAFVDVDTLAFATVFAHRKVLARLALFLYDHTFFDKLDGYGVLGQCEEVRVVDVAHIIAIEAIEVARIHFAVALDYELMATMPFHSALLAVLEMRKPHEIVELSYGSILAVHTVFEIEREAFLQKLVVVLARHNVVFVLARERLTVRFCARRFARLVEAQRFQHRYKLQVLEFLLFEKVVYRHDSVCNLLCKHGENVEIHTVFLHKFRTFENAWERLIAVCVNAQRVGKFVAVEAQSDKITAALENRTPLVVYERAVGLNAYADGRAIDVKFTYNLVQFSEKVLAGKQRLAALKGQHNSIVSCKIECFFERGTQGLLAHKTVRRHLALTRERVVETVFASQIAI